VEHPSAKIWQITLDPHGTAQKLVLHLPIDDLSTVSAVLVNGQKAPVGAEVPLVTAGNVSLIQVEIR
jgi:hypothetical protein